MSQTEPNVMADLLEMTTLHGTVCAIGRIACAQERRTISDD